MSGKWVGKWFYPVTPAGTICMWLESRSEEEAWRKLLIDAAHMPYDGKKGFQERGYTVTSMGRPI